MLSQELLAEKYSDFLEKVLEVEELIHLITLLLNVNFLKNIGKANMGVHLLKYRS